MDTIIYHSFSVDHYNFFKLNTATINIVVSKSLTTKIFNLDLDFQKGNYWIEEYKHFDIFCQITFQKGNVNC